MDRPIEVLDGVPARTSGIIKGTEIKIGTVVGPIFEVGANGNVAVLDLRDALYDKVAACFEKGFE